MLNARIRSKRENLKWREGKGKERERENLPLPFSYVVRVIFENVIFKIIVFFQNYDMIAKFEQRMSANFSICVNNFFNFMTAFIAIFSIKV